MESRLRRRLFGRTASKPNILQYALMDFEGTDYYHMPEDDAEIVQAMMDLGYVVADIDTGKVVLTGLGKGIIDGSIKTSYDVPRFLSGYVPREA